MNEEEEEEEEEEENLIHEGRSLTEILSLFRNLSSSERMYLYNFVNINSEDELIDLLRTRESQPGNESIESRLLQFPEQQLRQNLLLYVPPIFIVLGSVGNLLSFIVLRCRAMVKVSSYHYLASLAVADTLVLYMGLLRLWLGEVTGTDFNDSADWMCKVTVAFSYMASDLSVWLIIAVTVERYIVVCFPLRASTMINTNRAKKVIGFLVLLMFAINLHFFWTVEIVERPVDGKNGGNCEAAPHHQQLVNEIWPWVDAFIYSFLPFIFIIVLNILIVREVIKARAHRQKMQNTPEHHYHHKMPRRHLGAGQNPQGRSGHTSCRRSCGPGEGTKLTIMLLSVSFTFLITTLPMNITLIFTAFWNQQKDHDLRSIAQFNLAKTVAELLMYINHSINFCLYCATGQKFRQQIKHLMRCKKETNVYSSWPSGHTMQTRLTSTVRFNKAGPNERLLLTHASDDVDSNGDSIALRTKV
ncbi:growth hormone secretagogue receptor type 1-like [Littorina saxatilis]|uniref:growth hormone secretagogue receptor type 1-like n=1 Tax=Littorina saxatilis TaxID=31220 RepID=UPI0038B51CB8